MIVFTTPVISWMKFIGGGRVRGGWGGRWGWVGSRRRVIPSTRRQTAVLCVQYCTETATVNLVSRDGRQQQFDTPSSLISAHQWPHRPCSGPSWFYRDVKRLPVKADLAIYSPPLLVRVNSAIVWLSC